jgi:hypothetical protein
MANWFENASALTLFLDAVVCVWKAPAMRDNRNGNERGLQSVLRKSIAVCMKILETLSNFEVVHPDGTKSSLRLHLGLKSGRMQDFHIGVENEQWSHLVVGTLLNRMGSLLDAALPGMYLKKDESSVLEVC